MLHPTKYAAMLAEKMKTQGATGWLVNTGWSGGRYVLLWKPIQSNSVLLRVLVGYKHDL